MISQNSLTTAIYQALATGTTAPLVAIPGGGIHLDPAPDDVNLPCVLILCPEKAEQDAFFGSVCDEDLAPWKCKIMIFQERLNGAVSAQAIFDAVIEDLEYKVIAGKKSAIEETEGPTQSDQYMVATINVSLIV